MAGATKEKDISMKKNKKRKQSSEFNLQKSTKKTHILVEDDHQWRNLELALSIQAKDIIPNKKVELIFDFVISRAFKKENDTVEEFNTLSISRLIVYISNWIQSLLITSEKKTRIRDGESEQSQFCLDYRCWQILRSCLEESLKLRVSLSVSRDILRVISCVAKSTFQKLDHVHTNIEKFSLLTADCQIYNSVNDCLKLLFGSHGQLLNGNLDLWTVTVTSLLELVTKIFTDNLQGSDVGNLIIELSCLVLEQFSKFLWAHPCRKNGFRDFIEKLLEPLLHLLGMLPEQKRDGGSSKVQDLFNLVQEIVSNGLFHSVHLDEYLSLHGTEKYSSVDEWKAANARTLVKSYLRHLFEKLENLVSERKIHALSGVGEMFRLFVNSVKKHKRDSPDSNASRLIGTQSVKDSSKIGNLTVEKSKTSSPTCNLRKSFFDFFVLTMEPLLLDLRKHLNSEFEPKTFLLDVNFALKSVNKILSTMVRERIYLRTEDNSEGACLNFFKMSYGLLLSCYAKLSLLWNSKWGHDSLAEAEVLHSVANEFVFLVTNFLEIEYEVIGDDLVSTWLMILTFLAMDHSSETLLVKGSLSSVAIDLGCRVVNLYSELRQVNHALFALCRGLRRLGICEVKDEIKSSEILPSDFSLHGDKFAKSGLLLLCSQQFRLVIRNAIKSIPEGQASEYVQTLSADILESLEWMKVTRPVHRESSVKAEILGMVLSEIYSLVLESIPVTTGNSYRTGVSIENLIALLRPSMTLLIAHEDVGIDAFSFSVFGITSKKKMVKYKNDLKAKTPFLLLFFFRLYVSSRSLYRQTLSLMPPKSTKKMPGARADMCTTYSGDDLLEMTDFEDESYFSWVLRPSSPLLSIIRVLQDSILDEVSACHSCLIYVMHIMTLQRLGDLKRQIQCVEYIVRRSENVISSKLLDDMDVSALRKTKKKQDKFLSCLKQEAASLTIFVMGYLPAVDNDQLQMFMEFGSWDLGVCTVNEKTLHIAVWWIVCQNIDIWCNYAATESLKLFLLHLIYNSLEREQNGKVEENTNVELNVTKRKISLDLLCDTNFYDQRFVCRYIVPKICDVLKKLAVLLFDGSSNNNVELSSCDWTDALSVLSNKSTATRKKPATFYCTSSDLADKCCSKQTYPSQLNFHIGASRSLLNLLCHMMEKSLSFKSFSRCVIYLINFERLIVGTFMDSHGTLCLHEHFELLGLLVSCRRALRYLLITFCEKSEAYESLNLGIFSESSSPYTWLLQSLYLVDGWLKSMSLERDDDRVNCMLVSLMDQTSYVFFTICKHDFAFPIHLALRPKEIKVLGDSEGNLSTEPNSSSNLSKDIKACETLARIVDALEVETKSVFPFPKGALKSGILEADLTKLFSVVSCVQGLLWGLESALSDISTNYKDVKAKLMKHNYKTMSRIFDFLDIVVNFISTSSQIYLCGDHDMQNIENGSQGLNTDLLQSFLDGKNLEAAYVLRKLLISSSAIVRLSTRIKCSPLSSNVVQILLGCSEFLWTKFSQTLGTPKSSSIWLDGTVQFVEALGRQYSLNDAATTKDVFTKLVELNVKAIGKCISLQGKAAMSASHDTESVTKLLTQSQALEPTLANPLYGLDDLKTRLRKSFTVLIEKPSEMHLLSVMQALQQALAGTRAGYSTVCDIQMGITEGGVVSSDVAAGVDCLDSLLEFLKGNKLLTVVKTHMNGLIASLFNIVVHLQGPSLLYERPKSIGANNSPDSGSVVLMCVEVLTRIAGKSAIFHLESHHVSQSLHIPGTLFQSFYSLKQSKASKEYNNYSGCCFPVDKQFSMNLYAASCRLLWTIVKHHKSDCVRCIFLLQTSLQALLHCLEHVSADKADKKDFFTWKVEEGVKCATYLRRVYEEIRQQKDVFGQHSFKFLSDYVWVFSGHGSLKHGLKREIDEALRPGVYALIDVCSSDDLQHLHTVFGEGPRRSSLASLKHDYEHNFKYGGKV